MTVSSENKENKEQSTVQQVGKKQVSKSESADKAKKSTPVRKPRAVRSNRAADLRRGKDLKNDVSGAVKLLIFSVININFCYLIFFLHFYFVLGQSKHG